MLLLSVPAAELDRPAVMILPSMLRRFMVEDSVLTPWLLLGPRPSGIHPTGVSMLAPEEPAAPAAPIRRMLLLPLLPPVLFTL
jgi:hypothetical protein